MKSWGPEDGLSTGAVRALAQTADGWLWVGTDDGLYRFDGIRFERIAAEPGPDVTPGAVTESKDFEISAVALQAAPPTPTEPPTADYVLTPEIMGRMLVKLAEAYGRDGDQGGIVAMLGEEDAAAVKAFIAKEYQDKLAAGIQIESAKGVFKGFRVGRKDEQVFHDFSADAIADSLAGFLRPELAEIVKQAAAE